MVEWTEFDNNGRFFQQCSSSSDLLPNTDKYVLGVYDETYHFLDGEAKLRPSMPLSVSGRVITGIPEGTTLKLGDQTFIVNDGEVDIDGYHGSVKLSCWPYLDAEVEI
nr:hypothetical protein [uncultured Dethiosulfovibrio sp.]